MKKGFTLIELLVVISIIALLSSIIFARIDSVREKAELTRIARELKSIELAFNLYIDSKGWSNFPTHHGASPLVAPYLPVAYSTDPSIATLVADPNVLKPYLSVAPDGYKGAVIVYDNDDHSKNPFICGDPDMGAGANFYFFLPSPSARDLHNILDKDNNYSCGKVRISNSSGGAGDVSLFLYSIDLQ